MKRVFSVVSGICWLLTAVLGLIYFIGKVDTSTLLFIFAAIAIICDIIVKIILKKKQE